MHTKRRKDPQEEAGLTGPAGPSQAVPAATASGDTDSWKVYLLECADGTYYCGVAKNLERRLAQHNGLRLGGAKYTRSRRPVKLLAFCPCPDKRQAYSLEAAVKAAPRGQKPGMILAHTREAGPERLPG